jgi:hypothetical protein
VEVILPGKVLVHRLRHLVGGGHVDVAVGQVDRRAGERAGFQLGVARRSDLVGDGRMRAHSSLAPSAASPASTAPVSRSLLSVLFGQAHRADHVLVTRR